MSCHPNCPTSPPVSPSNTYSTSKHTHHCLQVITACREDYRHCLNINHVLIDGIPAHPLFVCFLLWLFLLFTKEKRKHMCYLFITVYYRVRYKRILLETARTRPMPLNSSFSGNHHTNNWKLRTRIYSLEDIEQNYSLLLYLVPI